VHGASHVDRTIWASALGVIVVIGRGGANHVFEENFCFGLVPVRQVVTVSATGIDVMHIGPPAYFFADVGGDDDVFKKWIIAHSSLHLNFLELRSDLFSIVITPSAVTADKVVIMA